MLQRTFSGDGHLGEGDICPASFPRGAAWFVALCSPAAMRWNGRYFPAEHALEMLSFECYSPQETRKVLYRGKRVVRVRSLLGSYLFVRFDREADDWGQIRAPDRDGYGGIDGIQGIIRNVSGMPMRVPDVDIVRLKRAEEAGAFDFSSGKSPFHPGDEVEIKEGPFSGLIAKVRSATAKKRVQLIIGALGSVEIDPAFLEKIRR